VTLLTDPQHRFVEVWNVPHDGASAASTLNSLGSTFSNASNHDLLGFGHDIRVRAAQVLALRKFGHTLSAAQPQVEQFEDSLTRLFGSSCAVFSGRPSDILWNFSLKDLVFNPTFTSPNSAGIGPSTADALPRGLHRADVLVTPGIIKDVGACAPLSSLFAECQTSLATLLVLDSCAFSILGASGAGVSELHELNPKAFLLAADLSMICPGLSAFSGDPGRTDDIRQTRQLPTAASVATAQVALQLASDEPHRRERVLTLAEKLLLGLRSLGFDTGPGVTPWVSVWCGEIQTARSWLAWLQDHRIAARALLSPQRSRLAFSLCAQTTDAQTEQLLAAMELLAKRLGIAEVAERFRGPIVVARPGTFATSVPCAHHWGSVAADLRMTEQSTEDDRSLRAQIVDSLENATWRLVNSQSASLRKTADGLRMFLTKKKR
jgi:hypothetical protein